MKLYNFGQYEGCQTEAREPRSVGTVNDSILHTPKYVLKLLSFCEKDDDLCGIATYEKKMINILFNFSTAFILYPMKYDVFPVQNVEVKHSVVKAYGGVNVQVHCRRG
jgi:hypothetical protein